MKTKKDLLSIEIGNKKISDDELVLLCSQFSAILKSGIQVSECTRLIGRQTSNKKLREILDLVSRDVESGTPLSRAFERHAKGRLPQTFFETIRASERSGDLSNAFETLKPYFQKQSKISKQIKSALIYPIFVIAVAVVVLIVIMAYVMPKMVEIFNNMGGDIPFITKILVAMSNFFSGNLALIFGGIALLIVSYKLYYQTKKGREKIDRLKLKLPLFGKIQEANYSAMFANTLCMLLKSGIILTEALRILAKIFENEIYKCSTISLSRDVETGRSLGRSMKNHECYPNILTEMTTIGEKTGELETILETTGEYYQNEAENATKSLLAKLEPALLVFIAGFAGFIVFAIYIPLFQMYDLF